MPRRRGAATRPDSPTPLPYDRLPAQSHATRSAHRVAIDWGTEEFDRLRTVAQRHGLTLNTVLQENVAGLKVVRAFGREAEEQARFNKSADAVLEQQLKVGRTFSFLFPVVFLIW